MGCPVVHWELWSEDPDKVAEFYGKVFDWEIRNIPEMNYHLAETGGERGINGGIMKPQQGPWPGNMAFYIDVDDLATYREKITDADGGAGCGFIFSLRGSGWTYSRHVEAECAGGGWLIHCHPEQRRSGTDAVVEGSPQARESRGSVHSGEVGGSFDSAVGRPRSG
jgi:predicted enzyme related to lactoylglutathione lyase